MSMKMQCKMNSTSLATLLFSLAFLCGNGYALQVDLTRISAKIAELMNTNLGVKFMQVTSISCCMSTRIRRMSAFITYLSNDFAWLCMTLNS